MRKPYLHMIWVTYCNASVDVNTKPGLYNPLIVETGILLVHRKGEEERGRVTIMGYNKKHGAYHGGGPIIKNAKPAPREVKSGKIKVKWCRPKSA